MLMSLVNSNYKSMKIQQSAHLGRALVLGNGESRSWFNPSKYANHPSFNILLYVVLTNSKVEPS